MPNRRENHVKEKILSEEAQKQYLRQAEKELDSEGTEEKKNRSRDYFDEPEKNERQKTYDEEWLNDHAGPYTFVEKKIEKDKDGKDKVTISVSHHKPSSKNETKEYEDTLNNYIEKLKLGKKKYFVFNPLELQDENYKSFYEKCGQHPDCYVICNYIVNETTRNICADEYVEKNKYVEKEKSAAQKKMG